MILYHFAHKKEASAFLTFSKPLKLKTSFGELYQNDLGFILISGEGIVKTLKAMTIVLSMGLEITRIINIGVAGAINTTLKIGAIFSVRTVYAQIADHQEYLSFSSDGELDCMTTTNRIINKDQLEKINYLAPIVDRELWAVANVAKTFNLPFESFKLISDYAGTIDNCDDIIAKAEIYSTKLVNHTINLNAKNPKPIFKVNLPQGFHFTQSLKNQYQRLVSKVNIDEIDIETIISEYPNPKDRSLVLITKMRSLANPIEQQATHKLDILVKPLRDIGAEVYFDPKLEKENFKISMDINSDKNISNLLKALNEISYKDFNEILNGEFDV